VLVASIVTLAPSPRIGTASEVRQPDLAVREGIAQRDGKPSPRLHAVSLIPSSPATATVSRGEAATYAVSVMPLGEFRKTVSLSCNGAPPQSVCSVSPASVDLGGGASTATVAVTTAMNTSALTQPLSGPLAARLFGLCLALPSTLGLAMFVSFTGGRRQRRAWLLSRLLYSLAFLCLLSIGVIMPADGANGKNRGAGGTPSGSYKLTVTGSCASGSNAWTDTTQLSLVVR
jgi:hypothetical protein